MQKIDTVKFVSQDKVEKLFSKIQSVRDRAIFSTMYYYGLRAVEVGMIKVDDVELENNRIFITAAKGGISGQHYLHPQVKRYIKAFLKERLNMRTLEKALFISQKDTPISSVQVYRLFKDYAAKARFPIEYRHPHVFRHSIAVHMAEAGYDIYQAKEHLRHRKIDSTLVYYAITNQKRLDGQKSAFASPMLARI